MQADNKLDLICSKIRNRSKQKEFMIRSIDQNCKTYWRCRSTHFILYDSCLDSCFAILLKLYITIITIVHMYINEKQQHFFWLYLNVPLRFSALHPVSTSNKSTYYSDNIKVSQTSVQFANSSGRSIWHLNNRYFNGYTSRYSYNNKIYLQQTSCLIKLILFFKSQCSSKQPKALRIIYCLTSNWFAFVRSNRKEPAEKN